MNLGWRCWLVLGALVAVLIAGLVIFRLREQAWMLKDQQRLEEIQQALTQAAEQARRATEARKIAEDSQKKADALEGQLEASRAKVRNRPKPETLVQCEGQLKDLDEHVALLESSLDLERFTVDALNAALFHQQSRADLLEIAWKKERERSQGFQKQAKRDKVKKTFLAVGSLIAGAGFGYGIASAR